eukprot:2410713-Rhodomonas_salina.1
MVPLFEGACACYEQQPSTTALCAAWNSGTTGQCAPGSRSLVRQSLILVLAPSTTAPGRRTWNSKSWSLLTARASSTPI